MFLDRIVQIGALVITLVCTAVGGRMLPSIMKVSDEYALRYTDVSVEGAPPIVALGTAVGALRGLIVDYLWMKVHIQKQKGLFYEVMSDAELITKLQPRFAQVWAFHGHNMAYNVSVATQTERERWNWVNKGINLVRNEGLRYNPDDLVLHKELAFWFAHKIEGVSDDAHFFYKREFTKEWHYLLGEPPNEWHPYDPSRPDDEQEPSPRTEWMWEIANAPDTLREAEVRTPGVQDLIDRIQEEIVEINPAYRLKLDRLFLTMYGQWKSLTEESVYAETLGETDRVRAQSPLFVAFDLIASDPELQEQWDTLIAHTRKRVLIDEYNMDPMLMWDYTRRLGPIDWRHGQAHALYWSRRGADVGEARVASDNDIFKIVNNDRLQLQAMQGMSRFGRITFDPFSNDKPGRYPDPRWVDTIDQYFKDIYLKHKDTRGWGGDTFIAFHENYMSAQIRERYRMGDYARAQQLMDGMNELYGVGTMSNNPRWARPLDLFVNEETNDQYQNQPHLVVSEVYAALRQGYTNGLLRGRPEIFEAAQRFADASRAYFTGNELNFFVNRYGEQRVGGIIANLEAAVYFVFIDVMLDDSLPLLDRITIYNATPDLIRLQTYRQIEPQLKRQFAANLISRQVTFERAFPEPPGLAMFEAEMAKRRAEQAERLNQQQQGQSQFEDK